MRRIIFKQSLNKRDILMSLFILCCLFISENMFSRKQWNRNYIHIVYYPKDTCILLQFHIYDYCFGPLGEHGYSELLDFSFTLDGQRYQRLMICEVEAQKHKSTTRVTMRDKLQGTKLQFIETEMPKKGSMWPDDSMNQSVVYNNLFKNFTFATILWYIPSDFKVENILITGRWHVDALFGEELVNEVYYPALKPNSLYSEVKTDLTQKYVLNQPEYNAVNVYPAGNAVVVKGAALGETIRVYSSSGTLVKSNVADQDVVNVKLPVNQIYIVKVGQERFKIAL